MKCILMCKIESEVHPEINSEYSRGEYDSSKEALRYALKYAGNDKYTAFAERRMLPTIPKVQKTKDTVFLIVSGIGEDYDNIKITYYVKEKD